MDEPMVEQLKVLPTPEPTIYEQLYRQLHAYNFGAIGFLELLDRFEEILHTKTHADLSDGGHLHQAELVNGNRCFH